MQLPSGNFNGSKINYLFWSNYLYQNIVSFLFGFSTSSGLSSKDILSKFDQLKNKSSYGYILIENPKTNFRGLCYFDNGNLITNDIIPANDSYICSGIIYIN